MSTAAASGASLPKRRKVDAPWCVPIPFASGHELSVRALSLIPILDPKGKGCELRDCAAV